MQIEMPHVLDNADDFPRSAPAVDLSPDGRPIEEAAGGKGATDQRLAPCELAGAERAPLDDAQPHRLDQPWAHRVQAGVRSRCAHPRGKRPGADITRETLLDQ